METKSKSARGRGSYKPQYIVVILLNFHIIILHVVELYV